MKVRARSFFPLSLVALSLGCSDPAPPRQSATTADPVADPVAPQPPAAPTLTPAEAAAQRAGHIATPCSNRASVTLRRIRQQYLGRADRDAGPERFDAIAGGIFFLSPGEVPACRTAIDEAVALQPAMPTFDERARRYIEALEATVSVVTDASNYYTRQSYQDDDGAHGRELHGELLRLLDAFVVADDALGDVTQELEQQAMDARVAELAADPSRRGLYLVERAHACAGRTAHMIGKLEVQPLSGGRTFHLAGGDGAALMTALAECQTHIDEMVAAPEAAAVDTGGSYRPDANRYIGAALAVGRALREDTTFSHPDDGPGLLNAAIEAYNSLVGDHNRL